MQGIPFNVATSLSEIERKAFCLIASEHNGAKFNFNRFEFEDNK